MAKPSAEERQFQQAREQLEKARKRGDLEEFVTAALKLPPAEREPLLAPTAAQVRPLILAAFQARDWARLEFWGARVDREPRLLGAEDPEAAELRWALLWSAARGRLWARARGHAAALGPLLPARLSQLVQLYLQAEGAPDPSPFAAAVGAQVEQPAVPDPRLGYESRQRPARASSPQAAPSELAGVESAVVTARATLPWEGFVETLEAWAAARPALAKAVLTLGAQLARGEVLTRLEGGNGALRQAREVARWSLRLGAPAELEPEALLALRVAAQLPHRGLGLETAEARDFLQIAHAAAQYPRLRALAHGLVGNTLFQVKDRGVVLGGLEPLVRGPDGLLPALKALLVWSLGEEGDEGPGALPAWLGAAIAEGLRAPGALGRALEVLPERSRQFVPGHAVAFLPLEVAEDFWDQAWGWGDEVRRGMMLQAFDELLARAQGVGQPSRSVRETERLVLQFMRMAEPEVGLDEIRPFLKTPEGRQLVRMLEADLALDGPDLPSPRARQTWTRFGDRVLPYRIAYLDRALSLTRTKPERERAVATYLGDQKRADPGAILEAIHSAEQADCRASSKALLDYLLARLKGSHLGLAVALLEAGRLRLRRGLRGPVARAFAALDAKVDPGGKVDPLIASARLEVRLLLGGRVKPPKPPRAPKPRKPRASQLPLGGGKKGW